MASKLTRKGQVTIPKPVRERLGLRTGSAVEFDLGEDGRVVLLKAGGKAAGGKAAGGKFAALRGAAGAGLSTDEIMALTRGER